MTNNSEPAGDVGPARLVPGVAAPGPPAGPADFLRVSDAKERYFGGAMSLRWWYRQVELGRLPHFRAGGAVLLRPADVAAFVAGMFREKAGRADGPDQAPPVPAPPVRAPTPKPLPKTRRPGLRFFTD